MSCDGGDVLVSKDCSENLCLSQGLPRSGQAPRSADLCKEALSALQVGMVAQSPAYFQMRYPHVAR